MDWKNLADEPGRIDAQTRVFQESESFRYFTARAGFDIPTLKSQDLVALPAQVGSISDVGCGTAVNLARAADLMHARRAVGVEPNQQTVEALRANHRSDSRLSFLQLPLIAFRSTRVLLIW